MTDLTDAGLRDRTQRECLGVMLRHQDWQSCPRCEERLKEDIALRDLVESEAETYWRKNADDCAAHAAKRARAEQRETIKGLMKACDELMTEFVSKKRAADWGIINDARVAGGLALRAQGGEK